MNFDLALFVSGLKSADDVTLFHRVDTIMEVVAPKTRIASWHPYEVTRPHVCLEHIPMAFFVSSTKLWHERDEEQEKPVSRFVKRRQKAFAEIQKEEMSAHELAVATARCLVRFAIWEFKHPVPETPWRHHWHQALLDNATEAVVFVACRRKETT